MEKILWTENLEKIYEGHGKKCVAVQGVNIFLKKGELVAVIGPSGCGKSTLLNLLGGLITKTSGKIFIDGKEISNFSSKERAKMRNHFFSYVMQSFALNSEQTVKKNLEIPLMLSEKKIRKKERIKKIQEVLEMVDLSEKINVNVEQLSGGQQQRVAIARALVQNAQIIFADEPTGALDSKNGEQIFLLLKKMVKEQQKTVMMVTHNIELAKQADRIYQMNDGIIE